ncbi:T9SS type A sorting domain-containing protein [Hymenobacter cavernae]|uniref:Secretion system C-terminal sorting domain-containing protein n=1 Tax=Hymenobacter cavernae TaxID=2044852 RepID=A0ABQ1UDR5_9BACT|nr:T9SS type A sorting domain-containing protein [Hymenobacter cavernae]GGF15433.1 hypothetical protein GCM10011383_28410 [Hymenobacter cavernae]
MKTIFYNLAVAGLSLCATATASAQSLPNGNFETWLQRRGSERPASWSTTDDWLHREGTSGINTGTVTKTQDKHNGSFAVKLQTQFVFSTWLPAILSLGKLPDFDHDKLGGVPFTGRPSHFQFQYKQTGYDIAGDSAHVVVSLTRTINGRRQVIAGADSLLLDGPSSYTLMRLPLHYQSALAPDSAFVLFQTATGETYTVGNALYLDDMAFADEVTATHDAKLAAALQVYPNPSTSGLFTLTAAGPEVDLAHASLTVTDAQGRAILRQAPLGNAQPRTLDLQSQPAGFYLLRLTTPQGFVVRRLIKT